MPLLSERITGRILTPAEWREMKRRCRSFRRKAIGRQRVNVYVCDQCGDLLITVDRDDGATPFLMPCENDKHKSEYFDRRQLLTAAARRHTLRMPNGSPIASRSTMYRVPEFFTPAMATIEFYRPSYRIYSQMKPGPLRDSVTNGQLLFRPINAGNGYDLTNLEDCKNGI